MAKKWGKTINKIKDKLHQQTEGLKSKINNNPAKHTAGEPVKEKETCKVTPDVCIVRQARRSDECLACSNYRST